MKNLFKSLAAFQQEVPVIHKGTKGYGYSYADLPAIFEVINPLMAKHKLGFTQLIETTEQGNTIKTIVFHTESGESLESNTFIPYVQLKGMNDYQSFGSGVSYFRRYALSSALGLVSDIDNDAADQKPAPQKAKLQNERFAKGIEKINAGELTLEQFESSLKQFDLTKEQLQTLKALKTK